MFRQAKFVLDAVPTGKDGLNCSWNSPKCWTVPTVLQTGQVVLDAVPTNKDGPYCT